MAAARNRSVRSSRSSDVRTNSSWPSVRGWNASATSTGHGLDAIRRQAPASRRAARAQPGRSGSAATRAPSASQSRELAFQASRSCGEPCRRLRTRRRLDLGRGQQVRERVEVVADPDPPLRARLERCRAATRERIEDDVARSRVAGDEGVGERGREARQVRAHRVEGVAPQALLVLPLGSERDRRQLERKLERELARGGAPRPCRHGGPEPPCFTPLRSRSVRWGAECSTRDSHPRPGAATQPAAPRRSHRTRMTRVASPGDRSTGDSVRRAAGGDMPDIDRTHLPIRRPAILGRRRPDARRLSA